MRNGLFRYKLIAHAMIFVILLSLSVHFLMMGVSFLSGRVFSGTVYATPGVPVSGAMVMASGSEGYGYATTNALGQYSITEGLKTGTYTVSVMAEGYLSKKIENVPVTVGQETSNVNFYLSLSGGISGKVTDAVSGLPLKNIMIMAVCVTNTTYTWAAVTDVNGNYRIITNLATGTYNVTALFPEGYAGKTVSGIAVTAQRETIGVDLALERSGIISGRVTATPSGVPLGNATVTAVSDDGRYSGFTLTNATGFYRISSGLGNGTYTVMAMYGVFPNIGFGQVTGVNVVAGAETPDININITVSPPPPSGMISGKVTDTGNNPIPGAAVSAEGPAGSGSATTDKNGDYLISKGLGTGTYTVTAAALGYLPKNITGVSVTAGQMTSGINFQLSKIPPEQSGRISGTVEGDENPIPEFPNLIAIFLAVTLVAVGLAKLFNVKARRVHLP